MSYPPTRQSELWAAAQKGDTRIVETLLRVGTGAALHTDISSGSTALHEALWAGHSAIARLLVEAGAPANVSDRGGHTPLHACAAGRSADDSDEVGLDVAEALLARGADVDGQGLDGATAACYAASRGKCALLRMLASNGASMHLKDRSGREPLSYVCDDATERFLLELIATVTLKPPPGAAARVPTSKKAWHLSSTAPPIPRSVPNCRSLEKVRSEGQSQSGGPWAAKRGRVRHHSPSREGGEGGATGGDDELRPAQAGGAAQSAGGTSNGAPLSACDAMRPPAMVPGPPSAPQARAIPPHQPPPTPNLPRRTNPCHTLK